MEVTVLNKESGKIKKENRVLQFNIKSEEIKHNYCEHLCKGGLRMFCRYRLINFFFLHKSACDALYLKCS